MIAELKYLKDYARTGDPDSFKALVLNYQGMVYSVCLRALSSQADAEDATQETFIKLATNAGKIKSNVSSWLYSCATFTARDFLRKGMSRRNREEAWMLDEFPAANRQEYNALLEKLEDALPKLPKEQQSLIVEYYLMNRTQEEMAQDLGISRVAVKKRVDKAIELLRKEMTLKDRHFEFAGLLSAMEILRKLPQKNIPAPLTPKLTKIGMTGLGVQAVSFFSSMSTGSVVLLSTAFIGLIAMASFAFTGTSFFGGLFGKNNAEIFTQNIPEGWTAINVGGNYEFSLDTTNPKTGAKALRISGKADVVEGKRHLHQCQVFQVVNAAPYRGHAIRCQGFLKIEDNEDRRAWFDICVLSKNQTPLIEGFGSIQKIKPKWRQYDTIIKIPEDAEYLFIVATFVGNGEAWFDGFTINIDDEAEFSRNVDRKPYSMNTPVTPDQSIYFGQIAQDEVQNFDFEGELVPRQYIQSQPFGFEIHYDTNHQLMICASRYDDSPPIKLGLFDYAGMQLEKINGIDVSRMPFIGISELLNKSGNQVTLTVKQNDQASLQDIILKK